MMFLIEEACTAGARLAKVCEIVALSPRTAQRWQRPDDVPSDGRKAAAVDRVPANKLSEAERAEILATANQRAYAKLPPSQIIPKLADDGRYLASESTFYRILHTEKQLAHRGRAKPATKKRPEAFLATAPNQLWSWDITYMGTTVKGLFFYLYLIMDIFSRKIVGWEVYAEESADHAAKTFRKAYLREGIAGQPLILHSDNGSPMKGATMLGTLQSLGVMPSFSRPSVSNDNPYSESLFKTLKYHPGLPEKPFETLEEARLWCAGFQHWYNEEHQHSAIKFVTPGQRHRGEDKEILDRRKALYAMARAANPARWSGQCRNWIRPAVVSLNPQKSTLSETTTQEKAA
jgi:transposase InsO family protein